MKQHRVRMAILATVALLVVTAVAALAWRTADDAGDAAPPAGAGDVAPVERVGGTPCPAGVERVYDLVARAPVTCQQAAGLAASYDRAVMAGGTFPDGTVTVADGYRCRVVAVSPPETETVEVDCAGPEGGAGFTWGV